jgi:acyl carrier protein
VDEILEQLQPVFRDVFDDPDLVITEASNAKTVEGWDSLAHINLVAAVQETFDVRFALGELETLQNVGDMIALMKRKMGR